MNVLPLIRAWLEAFNYGDYADMTRESLIHWIKTHYLKDHIGSYNAIDDLELAADCLIAAGIGDDREISGSVICDCRRF